MTYASSLNINIFNIPLDIYVVGKKSHGIMYDHVVQHISGSWIVSDIM